MVPPPVTSPFLDRQQQQLHHQKQQRLIQKHRSVVSGRWGFAILGVALLGGFMLLMDKEMMNKMPAITTTRTTTLYYTSNNNDDSSSSTVLLKQQLMEKDLLILQLQKELKQAKTQQRITEIEKGNDDTTDVDVDTTTTVDDINMINENNTISIISFSNGQTWCDRNALWNAYYQIRPPNIELVELMYYEAAPQPSKFWIYYQQKFATDPHFQIQYKWFNSSAPQKTPENPNLGDLRNQATKASRGYLLVNFDNDDIYHPNYLKYVTHHLNLNPTWLILGIGCHSHVDFNPDGSYEIKYCNGYERFDPNGFRYAAHSYSCLKSVFTQHNIWFPTSTDVSEENGWVNGIKRLNEQTNQTLLGQIHSINYTTTATSSSSSSPSSPSLEDEQHEENFIGTEFMLMKTITPFSKTAQVFYFNRDRFNRMKYDDTLYLLKSMEKYYQDIHELMRPSSIKALSSLRDGDNNDHDVNNNNNNNEDDDDSKKNPITAFLQPIQIRSWEDFHYNKYRNGYGNNENHPHCKGFAGLMGTKYIMQSSTTTYPNNANKVIEGVSSAQDCCKLCQSMDNQTAAFNNSLHYGFMNDRRVHDSIINNYCGAFTFDLNSHKCLLGIAPGSIDLTANNVFNYESGIRIEPTCLKCGGSLQPIPLV